MRRNLGLVVEGLVVVGVVVVGHAADLRNTAAGDGALGQPRHGPSKSGRAHQRPRSWCPSPPTTTADPYSTTSRTPGRPTHGPRERSNADAAKGNGCSGSPCLHPAAAALQRVRVGALAAGDRDVSLVAGVEGERHVLLVALVGGVDRARLAVADHGNDDRWPLHLLKLGERDVKHAGVARHLDNAMPGRARSGIRLIVFTACAPFRDLSRHGLGGSRLAAVVAVAERRLLHEAASLFLRSSTTSHQSCLNPIMRPRFRHAILLVLIERTTSWSQD